MFSSSILFFLLLTSTLLMNLTPALAEDPQPDTLVSYKEVDGKTLTLHVFLPERTDTKRPVAVFFHGGGWTGGNPSQFYPQSAYLRDRGMVCISAEYRLAGQNGWTPFDCIRDAFDVLRFVRENAATWGGDPDRIAAGGGSAGAHLAASTATLTAEDLAGDLEALRKARPNLLILFNPVYDNGDQGGWGHQTLGERWREASPAHNLHERVPPTLVMVGDNDHLIPVETVRRFASTLDRLKVPNHLILYPGAAHGFFNPDKNDGRFFHQTLSETDRFLVEQGWLPPVAP